MEERFDQLNWLINKFSPSAVNFRFDPIIMYRKKDSNQIKNNLDQFEYIIENVTSLGLKEMTFSFVTIYSKVRNRMLSRGYLPVELDIEKKVEVLNNLLKICDKYNIRMKACCQPDLLHIKGIEQAHCIDANRIEKLIGESIEKVRDTGQRNGCGCYKSKDIGGYTGIFKCKNNCTYCYANPAKN